MACRFSLLFFFFDKTSIKTLEKKEKSHWSGYTDHEIWRGLVWVSVNAYPCHDMDNSDGKASLKRQKSPETTTDTQGMSKFYWFYV